MGSIAKLFGCLGVVALLACGGSADDATASSDLAALHADKHVGEDGKVLICHIPPGNPAAAHEIRVGAPAVRAHLAHGDVLEGCGTDAGTEPDAGTPPDEDPPTDAGTCSGVNEPCGPGGPSCCPTLECSAQSVCASEIG